MDKCTKNLRGNPMNVNFNNSPNFGMAIKLDKSAHLVLKKQAAGMSEKSYEKFWDTIDRAVKRQESNPVDILIRECKYRNALAAEVVDHSEEPLKNTVFTQRLFFPKGLKFLSKAEKRADKINDMNSRIETYPEAVREDYISKPVIDIEG